MIYVIVQNGVVINRTQADQPLADNWIESDVAQIGWLYDADTGEFSEAPPPPVQIPQSVTMRQCRLQLLAIGKLADVDAAIAALPEPDKSAAQIEWEYAATVERNAPLIGALGPALGLDDAQLDDLFIEASKL